MGRPTSPCRGCGAAEPELVIDLGDQPLANGYVDADRAVEPEARFPLRLVFCPQCALVQIAETVDPVQLFGDYVYLSSSSDAFVAHAADLAATLIEQAGLTSASRVVELGSNDGYLLRHYRLRGIPVLGIEPAPAIARIAEARGVPTVNEFFSAALARRLRDTGVIADVLHANNVLAHLPDIHDALQGIETLLSPTGRLVVETPYVRDLVDRLEFDTIYHEHVFSYSLASLAALGDRLRGVLAALRRDGRRIAGYGAAAKGTVLLNALGIGDDLIEFIADRNPLKHGRLMPGVRIPIRPAEAVLEEMPDVVLLLVWNFADEVLDQQRAYVERGGRFLVPVPEPWFLP